MRWLSSRNVLRLEGANSTEFNKDTPHPVICLLNEQKAITDKGGTMRLGAQTTRLDAASRSMACYGADSIRERHRHRYEFNNFYREQFAAQGMNVTGTSPDGGLVEIIEIPDHPWFVAVSSTRSSSRSPPDPSPVPRIHRRGGQAAFPSGLNG